MAVLTRFRFYSRSNLSGMKEETEFEVNGYKKEENDSLIYYFKNENAYKFIIKKDILSVEVNDSKYVFDVNKKTRALIKNGDYSFFADIITTKLNINENKLSIEYTMDFNTFKGNYLINLELE